MPGTIPVIVIRPEPGNAATVAAAQALGLDTRPFPLFDMAPAPWDAPDPASYRALLAGSANVFRLGGEGLARLKRLPVHAVGAVTAEAARAAGFTVAAIGEGGLQPMVSALPPGRYLRLAGEKRVPLAMPDGVEVDDVVVYAAAGLPAPPALAELLQAPAMVLLHSGEAAAHFAAESVRLGVDRRRISLACLAPRIGLMAGEGWQHIEIAETRSDEAVLALAVQMCKKVSPEGHRQLKNDPMQDMTFGSPLNLQRTRSGRGKVAVAFLLIIAALAGGVWYGWRAGWLEVHVSGLPAVTPGPSPSASMSQAAAQTTANLAATNAALTAAAAKVSALEQRLAELNQQAAAAAGQAGQAEALLTAFAARRAIERGQPLGYLEAQLRVRFGATQQAAVDRVIAAAQKPVTHAMLSESFEKLSPQLIGGAQSEGTWDWMTRQLSELFVIRHADSPSPTAESRAERVREALAGGRIDVAIAEVERMPGKDAATEWLAHARDFVAAERALDQLETAALSFPPTPPVVAKPDAAAAPDAGAVPNAPAD